MKISSDYALAVFFVAFGLSGAMVEGTIPDGLLPIFMFACGAIAAVLACDLDN